MVIIRNKKVPHDCKEFAPFNINLNLGRAGEYPQFITTIFGSYQ